MTQKRIALIKALLKAIETGDEAAVAVVHPERYVQHNPQTQEGGEGLAALFKRLAKTSPRVNIVRAFSDGDFVFAHTEYDFASSRIGFEVFRFEGDFTVEHWDNIQSRQGPNASGHSMVSGPVEMTDLGDTESNRQLVQSFINTVLIAADFPRLVDYIHDKCYTEHSPNRTDGMASLEAALTARDGNGQLYIHYQKAHRVLAQGSFVLSVCEGMLQGRHTSFYDLYRLEQGKIVEHWDTIETVPPRSEWKNDNGKF